MADISQIQFPDGTVYDIKDPVARAAAGDAGAGKIFYGVCSTAAATQTKVVTIDDFELFSGALIAVKFENVNTAISPKLNISGTGAINMYSVGTTAVLPNAWVAGETLLFVYNGTSYMVADGGIASTSGYGVTKLNSATDSTSTTEAATPSAVKSAYDLAQTANNNIPDVSGKLDKSGGTMTGDLFLNEDPAEDMQAVTKQYVDNSIPPAFPPVSFYGGANTEAHCDEILNENTFVNCKASLSCTQTDLFTLSAQKLCIEIGNNKYFELVSPKSSFYNVDSNYTYNIYQLSSDGYSVELLYTGTLTYINQLNYIKAIKKISDNKFALLSHYSYGVYLFRFTVNGDYTISYSYDRVVRSSSSSSSNAVYAMDLCPIGNNRWVVLFNYGSTSDYKYNIYVTVVGFNEETNRFSDNLNIDMSSSTSGTRRIDVAYQRDNYYIYTGLHELSVHDNVCLCSFYSTSNGTVYFHKIDASSLAEKCGAPENTLLSKSAKGGAYSSSDRGILRFVPLANTNKALVLVSSISYNTSTSKWWYYCSVFLYNGEDLIDLYLNDEVFEIFPGAVTGVNTQIPSYNLLAFSEHIVAIGSNCYFLFDNNLVYADLGNLSRTVFDYGDLNEQYGPKYLYKQINANTIITNSYLYSLSLNIYPYSYAQKIPFIFYNNIEDPDTKHLYTRLPSYLLNSQLNTSLDNWDTSSAYTVTASYDSVNSCAVLTQKRSGTADYYAAVQAPKQSISGSTTEANNDKYYFRCEAKNNDPSYTCYPMLQFERKNSDQSSYSIYYTNFIDGVRHPDQTAMLSVFQDCEWHIISTVLSTYYSSKYYYLFNNFRLAMHGSAIGQSVSFKNVFVVNLSTYFGRGNEPTVQWCNENFSVYGNSLICSNGEIINNCELVFPNV